MKNRVRMPAVESLSVETSLLVVPALALLVTLQARGTAAFGHASGGVTALLAAAGVITAVPLLMFAGRPRGCRCRRWGCCSTSPRSCSS